jgi:hypothetical protein
MLDCTPHRDDLRDRLASVRRLLASTHQGLHPDVSREARGLVIVLLYASYEQLLTSLCRSLLETTAALRVGNRRLRPGFQVFAAYSKLQAANVATQSAIWRGHGLDVVKTIADRRFCTISSDVFPYDGTNMKRTQVSTFCNIFELGDPAPILREIWGRLDTIVAERNGIAHGRLRPEEIGRNYSISDLQSLVDLWEKRWNDFLDAVEAKASTRAFYRLAR